MKKLLSLLFAASFSLTAFSQSKPQSYIDSVSYSLGMDIAVNILNSQLDTLLSTQMIAAGVKDGLQKEGYKISPEQCKNITQAFFIQMQQKAQQAQQTQQKETAEIDNILKGKEFLEKNKQNDSIKVTASGLQYKVLKEGNGNLPTKTDRVTLHYKGTLINGDKFDSSYDRGQPTTFGVTQVIPGFSEAIQLMSPGAHYIVYIPQDIAYGSRAMGKIKAYSTLIFEIELLSIPTQETKSEPQVKEVVETKETVQPEEKEKETKPKKKKRR